MEFRHEYKFQISPQDRQLLLSRLRPLGLEDPHASAGEYRVYSLYFDDLQDTALRQKLDGVENRDKFRLRYYNGDLSFLRLEKKSKRGNLCQKRSASLPLDQAKAVLARQAAGPKAVRRSPAYGVLRQALPRVAAGNPYRLPAGTLCLCPGKCSDHHRPGYPHRHLCPLLGCRPSNPGACGSPRKWGAPCAGGEIRRIFAGPDPAGDPLGGAALDGLFQIRTMPQVRIR